MSRATIDACFALESNQCLIPSITGGAPELNRHFEILELDQCVSARGKHIIDRQSNDITTSRKKLILPEWFAHRNESKCVCSLPFIASLYGSSSAASDL
jgi:hypothetical protein